jgi:UDP-N-acetylmuramoylalanine--D-glutamate ligase
MDDLRNKRVVVAGLGHFGGCITAAQWLCRQGARVLVTDMSPAEKLVDSVKQLDGYPVEWRMGEHRVSDFTSADLVVASPALNPRNEFTLAAKQAGVPVTTEICLFLECCPLPVVAVSGTKGKSTSSSLLALMLQSKYRTWLGGNIGKSLLFDLPAMREGEIVLLEVSSFMLEYLGARRWAPHVALMTLLEVDHLDWHGSAEAYHAAKGNLVRFQKADDFAVIPEECEIARALAKDTKAQVVLYGAEGRKRFITQLLGEHNQFNAQGAFAAARCMGVEWESAQKAIADFRGLPHRLQRVYEWKGVQFVDDSIATTPTAAEAALRTFPAGKVIQIIGGKAKGIPFDGMCDAIAADAKAALCIGQEGPGLAEKLKARKFGGTHDCGDLRTAMAEARRIAAPGDVVLLSTACASYGQFSSFEERGDKFLELAKELFQ